MGILAKSASFKKPKCFEPVNKAKPSTVMNPLVSENARNDILTSILGSRSLTGSVTVPVHSKAQSSAQHLNKGNRMADSNILGTSGGEGARSFLGNFWLFPFISLVLLTFFSGCLDSSKVSIPL